MQGNPCGERQIYIAERMHGTDVEHCRQVADLAYRSRRYLSLLLFGTGGVVGIQLLGQRCAIIRRLLAGLQISGLVVALQSAGVAH